MLTLLKTFLDVVYKYNTPKVAKIKRILDWCKILYYVFLLVFLAIRYVDYHVKICLCDTADDV